MATGYDNQHPLPRPGLRQRDRTIPALDPSSLELEDRDQQQRLEFAQKLATLVRFQKLGDETPADATANWQPFFDDFDFAAYALKQGDFEKDFQRFSQSPHGGLYSIYLKLLEQLRSDLNDLPKKHLDFYYRDVLQLSPRPAETDRVHILFEPARNRRVVRIPANTALAAGKEISYQTANEVFVSQAKMVARHAIYSDSQLTDQPTVAFEAESLDGQGEPLTDEQPNWKPFGSADLPVLETGFAIASPVLALREGERTISVTVTLRTASDAPELPADDDLRASLLAELSGEEGWLGPFVPDSASASSVGGRTVKLVIDVNLAADADPVSYYDISKLEGGFDTISPILKLSVDESANGLVQRLFSTSTVSAIKIDVSVSAATEFDLENDLGRLNPDKPFMPFGPQPVAGGSFYVSSEELLSKEITDFKLRIRWQDAPAKLADRYSAYLQNRMHRRPPKLKEQDTKSTAGRVVTSNRYFTAAMALVKRGQPDRSISVELFDRNDATETAVLDSTPVVRPFIVHSYTLLASYFSKTSRNVKALFPNTVRLISRAVSPVSRSRKRNRFRSRVDLRVRLPQLKRRAFRLRKRKFGVIRVTLEKDFFHRIYPYYLGATIADEQSEVSPQEPYTPVVESMELDYRATASYDQFDEDGLSAYQKKTVQLFQITPFGHAEQHAFLKSDLPFVSDRSIRLSPRFADAGSLMLGVEGLQEGGSLSMLVQVAQGTANPLREREKVEWSLLVRNHWRPFEANEILVDETNQLLTSGIVRLKIPNEPIHDNTLFSPELAWLRASVPNHADAVCDFRAIHLHAVTAHVLQAGKNDASGSIAAGSLTKFKTPVASIKSLSQPYASFGGRPAESDADFYRRTSERLRHKQRAVTAADYERLVLEKFADIHRVRCLTHTDADSCVAPGKVSLIVIPTTPPEARFDRLKPRADLDTLSRIEDYVNSINTYQVSADARNPDYDEVQLALSVRFQADRPFAPYQGILNEALVQFLSPWANDAGVMPKFSTRLHKSQIVKFIEELDYVDFVSDVRLFRGTDSTADLMSVQPSSPAAILVSAAQHSIDEAGTRT